MLLGPQKVTASVTAITMRLQVIREALNVAQTPAAPVLRVVLERKETETDNTSFEA